jgi:ribosomal protein S18 acetylase RimI-like enzyme
MHFTVDGPVTDVELNALHAAAFEHIDDQRSWLDRMERYSLFWVTARRDRLLVGFVNIVGDGGSHAVVLDTSVHPSVQGMGIGTSLIRHAAAEAAARGCQWLHADYESRHASFYEQSCGMRRTCAGLLKLRLTLVRPCVDADRAR